MISRIPLVALAVAATATVVAAQQPIPSVSGTTPSACLASVTAWRNATLFAARNLGGTPDFGKIQRDAQARAAACAAQFSVDAVPAAQLTDLSNLYAFCGDTAGARRAIDRALTARDLTQRQHAETMLAAIRAANRAADPFAGRVARSEELVRRILALPDSLASLKLAAHLQMLGQYEYADVDAGIQEHAAAALTLGRGLHDRRAILTAYRSLARAAADYLHPDSALRVLAAARRELGAGNDVEQNLGDLQSLYALVGTPATPIDGAHWINAPDRPDTIAITRGKVWLIQFTAHWCAPCRNSYPGMKEVAARFADAPFETVFVTQLYGNFEGGPASPSEELADDRAYYTTRHGIPFRVAINPGGTAASTPASNEGRYKVMGIPQIVAIDSRGMIRQIVTGWDQGNTARLTALVDSLVHEPAR
jgi:thiol-disulfide isomerase/thioredoxin